MPHVIEYQHAFCLFKATAFGIDAMPFAMEDRRCIILWLKNVRYDYVEYGIRG